MNCKPGQLAWIDIPRTPENVRFGLMALQGHVVRTVNLVPDHSEPVWRVDPPQRVVFTGYGVDAKGRMYDQGDLVEAEGLPDRFLRPFDPLSEPEPHQVTIADEVHA